MELLFLLLLVLAFIVSWILSKTLLKNKLSFIVLFGLSLIALIIISIPLLLIAIGGMD